MRISDWSSDVCSSDLAETQSQVRRVALLDFSAPSTPVAQPTAPIDAVSNGMLLDFRDMRRSEAAAPSVNTFSAISPDSYGIVRAIRVPGRSEEHTSELQSLMRISYAVFCLKKKKQKKKT